MSQKNGLTQDDFDSLLAWLDPDPDRAGEKYETIRRRLIKIFTCRGCHDAEELADKTIDRVASRVKEVSKEYVGDPALYFYGVAQKIFLESVRKPPAAPPPPPQPEDSDEAEREDACLRRCMETLLPASQELALEYYRGEKRAKVERRRKLAERLGIAQNALRIRAHRIRTRLQKCVEGCLERALPE